MPSDPEYSIIMPNLTIDFLHAGRGRESHREGSPAQGLYAEIDPSTLYFETNFWDSPADFANTPLLTGDGGDLHLLFPTRFNLPFAPVSVDESDAVLVEISPPGSADGLGATVLLSPSFHPPILTLLPHTSIHLDIDPSGDGLAISLVVWDYRHGRVAGGNGTLKFRHGSLSSRPREQ